MSMLLNLKTKICGYIIGMSVEKTKGLFTNRYKNMSNSYLKIKICGYRDNMMLNKLKHKQKGILC